MNVRFSAANQPQSRPVATATRMFARFKAWTEKLKLEVIALWFAYRHPDTPWYAKLVAALVVGYAFSPIDLIPDFIPILGLLDDAILVPLGIWIALKLIPPGAYASARAQAQTWLEGEHAKPRNMLVAAAIVALWIAVLALCALWAWHEFA